MTWSNEHIISRELIPAEGPWEHDNRDSVLEQGYETSGLPPEACCPNKDCTQGIPIVVSGIRNIDNPVASTTPDIMQERYLDYFCPQYWSFENFRHNKDTVRDWSFMRASIEKGKKIGHDGQAGPTPQRRIEGQHVIPLETSGITELHQPPYRLRS